MNLIPKKNPEQDNGRQSKQEVDMEKAFDHACRCFKEACRSEQIQIHGLSLHKSDPPRLQAVVLSRTIPGACVTLINDTITFDWRSAAFIFLQHPATRELIRQIIERNRVFGVNTMEVIENYEIQKKKSMRQEMQQK